MCRTSKFRLTLFVALPVFLSLPLPSLLLISLPGFVIDAAVPSASSLMPLSGSSTMQMILPPQFLQFVLVSIGTTVPTPVA